jgi:hypothetical protein
MDDLTRRHQTREIELELIRVRSAAEAARLEARAAELELMLRRMSRGETVDALAWPPNHVSSVIEQELDTSPRNPVQPGVTPFTLATATHAHAAAHTPAIAHTATIDPASHETRRSAEPWSNRLLRLQARERGAQPQTTGMDIGAPTTPWGSPLPSRDSSLLERSATHTTDGNEPVTVTPSGTDKPIAAPEPIEPLLRDGIQRLELAHLEVRRPHFERLVEVDSEMAHSHDEPSTDAPEPLVDTSSREREDVKASGVGDDKPIVAPVVLPALNELGDLPEDSPRRFRPASWLVSTLAHVAILVLLGFVTLASNEPKDQLAFTASASESSEQAMETFQIESSEPVEPSEPEPSETAYDLSEVGTIAVTEVSMDIPEPTSELMVSDLLSNSSSASSLSMKSLQSDQTAAMQFCGVDGGGNHFVYLVDSSGSMKDGFQSARNELLNSIDQLQPNQRFYVVFFDEEPDYMRLSDPDVDEPRSVMATPENKKRLRRWAATVEMNKGKAPYEVLPFALSLRPDVIFLLSDGEFPDAIAEILREQNRNENLFGDSGPISIVHTIRYHGIEGETGKKAEATMVQIAQENGGQYRHVPKP